MGARCLIIGGGDGGALEEVLKHRSVARATMVELDPGVVESRQEVSSGPASAGRLDDPRARLMFDDGVKFVAGTEQQFDVIIVDSTDLVGPGTALFTEAFYADCRRGCAPVASWSRAATCSPEPERVRACRARLGSVFRDTSLISTSVPSYPAACSCSPGAVTIRPARFRWPRWRRGRCPKACAATRRRCTWLRSCSRPG